MMTDKQILDVLKYNVSRSYIGAFTPAGLSAAYKQARENQYDAFPVQVGKISGAEICCGIWRQMSYNPVRFGVVSPFTFDGRDNIYRFCRGDVAPQCNHDADGILQQIRYKLIAFMTINGNRQWNDVLQTRDGYVYVSSYDTKVYNMLARLRDCIKIIASQNVADFKDKSGKYHDGIRHAVTGRHVQPAPATGVVVDDEVARFIDAELYGPRDDYMDMCQSVLDNPDAFGDDMYEQVLRDMNILGRAHTR